MITLLALSSEDWSTWSPGFPEVDISVAEWGELYSWVNHPLMNWFLREPFGCLIDSFFSLMTMANMLPEDPLMAFVSFWKITFFLGVLRNNSLFQNYPLKLNINTKLQMFLHKHSDPVFDDFIVKLRIINIYSPTWKISRLSCCCRWLLKVTRINEF